MSNFIVRPGVDIPAMLKSKGYSSYRIAREKTFCSGAMQKFRDSKLPSWGELAKLCDLLHVSPVDLIAFQADDGTITTFDSIPATPIAPPLEPIQAATEPGPVAAPVAHDDAVTVTLTPAMQRNMDGAIRCGYSSDRVQYTIRAINTQIQQDIAAEKERRRSCVQPAMSYTYDLYYDDNPPDDY